MVTAVRPLSPVPIALASVALAAILWSFEALDDMVGGAVVVWISQMLVWLGMRGSPTSVGSAGSRAALAIGGAMPTAACALALVPWVAGGDGMEGLGRVIGMMVLGVPLVTAVAGVVIWTRERSSPRATALARTVVMTTIITALAWSLAIAWVAIHGSNDKATLLTFPGLATWWLLLPLAEMLVPRRAGP
jgi:hypothetical protein